MQELEHVDSIIHVMFNYFYFKRHLWLNLRTNKSELSANHTIVDQTENKGKTVEGEVKDIKRTADFMVKVPLVYIIHENRAVFHKDIH